MICALTLGCPGRNVTALFVRATDDVELEMTDDVQWSETALGGNCPLFARKFDSDTAHQLQTILNDCNSGLQFVEDCKIHSD